ncbi:MAG: choice-of-anchor tandem repeat GloVer-containing protein [Tepidisphaerales bacterium]
MRSWFSAARILCRALAFTNHPAIARSRARRRNAPPRGSTIVDSLEPRTLLSAYAPLQQLAAFNGSNGANPVSSLIMDSAGDLFGTTYGGGTSSKGSIFEIAAGSNTVTSLASFNTTNGANPYGHLVRDASGNLFGTAHSGGDVADDPNGAGFGTIFELPSGSSTITALATFNKTNGANSYGGLVMDSSGNLFGATFGGGDANGDGTIFELPAGSSTITTLALFKGGAAGANPVGDLYMDASGNLFGTTYNGGDIADDPNGYGLGTIFKLPHGSSTISVLATFNGTNGAKPYDGLVVDSSGNLFGTASAGGDANGDGTVFELPSGASSITRLAAFSGGTNGAKPYGDLVIDANGNLFGTTNGGGDASGQGIVFEVAAGSNAITPLATFDGAANGANAWAGLLLDTHGNLFGTTPSGGDVAADPNGQGYGIVFELALIGPPAKLAFVQPPSFASAGQTISPAVTVAVEDAAGHLIATDSSSVTLAVSNPSNATLNGTLTVAAVNGVATFSDLSLPTAGSYTLLASDAALTTATSSQFTVTNALFTLNGNSTMIANGDITPSTTDFTDFGSAPLNTVNGKLTRTFTIQSIANTTVTLTGNPVISGPNAADFTVSTQPSLSIAGTSNTTFTISFSPTIVGTETATVSLSSSDSSQSPFTFEIQGEGLNMTTGSDNLQTATLTAGTGNGAMSGQSLNVLYTGSLLNGTVFDASSLHGNTPFALTLGAGQVITGWDEGLVGMQVGESRLLVIPSALGYGASGSGSIPGGATLIFQVQLVSISGPTIGVTGSGQAIASGDTTLSLADGTNFGDVAIGASATSTFNISNLVTAGTLSLTGTSPVSISGPGADQFTITQPTLTSQAGSFSVKYTPAIDEIATATITIASNDPNHPSFTFNVGGETPTAATHLVFTQQPSNVPVGQAIAPAITVTLEDSSNNPVTGSNTSVTLAIASGPNNAVLSGTTTISLQNGVATFSDLSIGSAGIYTLVATGASLTGITSSSFVVGGMHLTFVEQPTSQPAGHTIAPPVTVAVEDELGDIITTDGSSVTLAIASGPNGATLGGTTTVAMQNGVATFSDLAITDAGSYTLAASDGSLAGATSNSFNVAVVHLAFVQQPAGTSTDRTMAPVTVALEDASGNIITDETSSVTLSIASGPNGAVLGGTLTKATQNGIATFNNLSIGLAGAYTLSAKDGNLTGATSNSFQMVQLHLAFVRQPAGTVAGMTMSQVTVQLENASGAVVTNEDSPVTLTIASGPNGAVLSGTVTAAMQNGVATFSDLSIAPAGTYKLLAGDGNLAGVASSAFVIAPLHLAFVRQPASALAGHTIAPAITVKLTDSSGKILAGDHSNVSLAIATGPKGATLGGTLTVAAKNGIATFSNLSITRAGTYTLVASCGTLGGTTGSVSFTISPAAASKLVFSALPAGVAAGGALSEKVDVMDQYGNLVASSSATVKLTLSSGPTGKKPFTLQAKAVNGVATFTGIPVQTAAGVYRFQAQTAGLASLVSGAFTIKAAAAAKLAFVQQPSTAVASQAIAPAVTVDVLDRYGNIITSDSSKVTLSLGTHPASATLGGTPTVAAAAGVAVFSNLLLNKAGTYTLKAADGKLTAAVSRSFVITAAA